MIVPVVRRVNWFFFRSSQVKSLNQMITQIQNSKEKDQNEVSGVKVYWTVIEVKRHSKKRQRMSYANSNKGSNDSFESFSLVLVCHHSFCEIFILSWIYNHERKHYYPETTSYLKYHQYTTFIHKSWPFPIPRPSSIITVIITSSWIMTFLIMCVTQRNECNSDNTVPPIG